MGWFSSIFGGPSSGSSINRSPSFEDLSMGTAADAEKEYSKKDAAEVMKKAMGPSAAEPEAPPKSPPVKRTDPWASVFNPGRNYNANMSKQGSNYFDKADKGDKSVWEEIVKGERLRLFQSFDKDADGFLNKDDLKKLLGNQEDVDQLIAAADTNGDGKISFYEFNELLRNS